MKDFFVSQWKIEQKRMQALTQFQVASIPDMTAKAISKENILH